MQVRNSSKILKEISNKFPNTTVGDLIVLLRVTENIASFIQDMEILDNGDIESIKISQLIEKANEFAKELYQSFAE